MTPKLHKLNEFPSYKKWVLARDRALEDLHTNAQLKSADVMRGLLGQVLLYAKASYSSMKQNAAMGSDGFENQLKSVFNMAAQEFVAILKKLRADSYTLARASESEILARMFPEHKVVAQVTSSDAHSVSNKPSMAGGDVEHRVRLYLDRMRRKIVSVAQTAALNAKDERDFLDDVMGAFPKRRVVRRPKRILKPQLMESDDGFFFGMQNPPGDQSIGAANLGMANAQAGVDAAQDNIDQSTWDSMLSDYKSNYVPKWRQPEYVVGIPITDPMVQKDGSEVWYAWEFERDMTNEFVSSVRDGQISAANSNGVTDFVWVAVIDSETDACCKWRDGLLVSEIEKQVGKHSHDDESCGVQGQGTAPPLHFNCRCSLAPATKNIPQKPDTGQGDFDAWLNS